MLDERERKRLIEYFKARNKRLRKNMEQARKTTPDDKVELGRAKIKGRIEENNRLLSRIEEGKFWDTIDWYIGRFGSGICGRYECAECGEEFKNQGNWVIHAREEGHDAAGSREPR